MADIEVTSIEDFELPAEPTKKGYTFAGWYIGGDRFDIATAKAIDGVVTVTAKWTENTPATMYTVTFMIDGKATEVEVAEGQKIATDKIPEAVKTGYIFSYWHTEAYEFGEVDVANEAITADVTYVACFAKAHTITYVTNIKGVEVATGTAAYNSKFTRPTDPAVEGMTFAGWYTEADGKGDYYGFGDWVKKDITVYAKWVYAATLQYNNGTGETLAIYSTAITTAGADATVAIYDIFLAGVELAGYEAIGYYTEGENGAEVPFIPGETVINDDVTIWVKWVSETKVTMTFDTGIADLTVDPIETAYNQKFVRPTDPAVEGMTFAGWYTEANGKGDYYGFGDWAKEDMTVYAKWVYTATLQYNNGTSGTLAIYSTAITTAGADATVSIHDVYLNGVTNGDCIITGYYTLDGDDKVPFVPGTTVITGDTTIYINWVEPMTLTVADGVLTKMVVAEGVTDVVIPSQYNGVTITSIGAQAIMMQNGITTLTIPSTVTSVGNMGIFFNNKLETIVFEGNGLTTLVGGSLFNNSALTALYLPSSIESLPTTNVLGTMDTTNLIIFWGESFADAQTFDYAKAFGTGTKIAFGATSIDDNIVGFKSSSSITSPEHYEAVAEGKTVEYYAHCSNEYYQSKIATWYTDADCTIKYNFATPVTDDMTLYAVFADTDYTRVFTLDQLTKAFANGGKIQLINNFVADLVVDADKTVELDLNGYTITAKTDHAITNNGNLTIDGVVIAKGETVDFDDDADDTTI